MIHKLKIKDSYLKNLIEGRKRAEIRLNDRDYQVGDLLEFYKDVAFNKQDCYIFEITHIHSGLGMDKGYIVLSVIIMN